MSSCPYVNFEVIGVPVDINNVLSHQFKIDIKEVDDLKITFGNLYFINSQQNFVQFSSNDLYGIKITHFTQNLDLFIHQYKFMTYR